MSLPLKGKVPRNEADEVFRAVRHIALRHFAACARARDMIQYTIEKT